MSVYFDQPPLLIRSLTEDDVLPLTEAEIAQGWHSTPDKLNKRIRDEKDGKSISFCAVWNGIPVGYVCLYFHRPAGPFADTPYPEIVDFNVLKAFRNRGIGSHLMDCAEAEAAARSPVVTISVGLHSGYGAAQRMYVRRGYIPDGSGVWYEDRVCPPYTMCENGDALVLYLSKNFKKES